jgi:hypothetical protein
MIVDDCDVKGVTPYELEADSPLIVDPNTPLPLAIALESLKPVRRRLLQILELSRGVELRKAHCGARSNLWRQTSGATGCEEPLGLAVRKRSNHGSA